MSVSLSLSTSQPIKIPPGGILSIENSTFYDELAKMLKKCCEGRANISGTGTKDLTHRTYEILFRQSESWKRIENDFKTLLNEQADILEESLKGISTLKTEELLEAKLKFLWAKKWRKYIADMRECHKKTHDDVLKLVKIKKSLEKHPLGTEQYDQLKTSEQTLEKNLVTRKTSLTTFIEKIYKELEDGKLEKNIGKIEQCIPLIDYLKAKKDFLSAFIQWPMKVSFDESVIFTEIRRPKKVTDPKTTDPKTTEKKPDIAPSIAIFSVTEEDPIIEFQHEIGLVYPTKISLEKEKTIFAIPEPLGSLSLDDSSDGSVGSVGSFDSDNLEDAFIKLDDQYKSAKKEQYKSEIRASLSEKLEEIVKRAIDLANKGLNQKQKSDKTEKDDYWEDDLPSPKGIKEQTKEQTKENHFSFFLYDFLFKKKSDKPKL